MGLNYTTWYDVLGWGTEGARRATGVPQPKAPRAEPKHTVSYMDTSDFLLPSPDKLTHKPKFPILRL